MEQIPRSERERIICFRQMERIKVTRITDKKCEEICEFMCHTPTKSQVKGRFWFSGWMDENTAYPALSWGVPIRELTLKRD